MDNPPGIKNCHLIDIEKDEVGTHGVSIHPNRTFDDNAQWKYQEGLLEQQVNNEIADRIIHAHQRLLNSFGALKVTNTIVSVVNIYILIWKTTLERTLYKEMEKLKPLALEYLFWEDYQKYL
jgi:hypothetical protein